MASMSVEKYIDIGTGGTHHSSSWQFAKDPEFTKIIDQSLKDHINVKKWHSMLPKLPEDKTDPSADEYYTDLDEIWGRVKIHVGETDSDWFVIGPRSQRLQRVLVTDNTGDEELTEDEKVYFTNSNELEWSNIPDVDFDDLEILGPIIPDIDDGGGGEEILPPEELPEGDGGGGDPILPEYGGGTEGGQTEQELPEVELPDLDDEGYVPPAPEIPVIPDTGEGEQVPDVDDGTEQEGGEQQEVTPTPPEVVDPATEEKPTTSQPDEFAGKTKEQLTSMYENTISTLSTLYNDISVTSPTGNTAEDFARAIGESGRAFSSLQEQEEYFNENSVPYGYAGDGIWLTLVGRDWLTETNYASRINTKIRSM